MILEIPLTSDASQEVVIQLGAVKYQLNVRYNDRVEAWFLTITDFATGVVLVESIGMLLGGDLLDPYNLDVGHLVMADEYGTGIDATADDLGTRVKLYWLTFDE